MSRFYLKVLLTTFLLYHSPHEKSDVVNDIKISVVSLGGKSKGRWASQLSRFLKFPRSKNYNYIFMLFVFQRQQRHKIIFR